MTKKSTSDLLYIPNGFLSRAISPTKRDLLCFMPFIGKEITRHDLELGVSRILQSHGYAKPMIIGKMLIGQYENNYSCIFNISESVNIKSHDMLSNVSFEGV